MSRRTILSFHDIDCRHFEFCKLRGIAAIKPFIHHPIFLAKMALQIENISEGRLALNLVNAWNKPEFKKAGIPFPEHDDRYAYGREWMSVVWRLLSGETVTQGR